MVNRLLVRDLTSLDAERSLALAAGPTASNSLGTVTTVPVIEDPPVALSTRPR
jgi:hypothetical protein